MKQKATTPAAPDGRRDVRHLPTTRIAVAVEDLGGLPVELFDLSGGGFAIISSKPFWTGMTYRFCFTTASGRTFRFAAKSVHSSEMVEDTFISGWEFSRTIHEASLRRFVEAVTRSPLGA